MEKTLETLNILAEQGYGNDTIWETIDRLESKSDAEEIETLKRFAGELKRQRAAEKQLMQKAKARARALALLLDLRVFMC